METVGEYFAQLADAEDLEDVLFVLTLDQFNGKVSEYAYWKPLLVHVEAVISEWKDEPFNGPGTCALVMDYATKRLAAKEKLRAPLAWFAAMKALRRESAKRISPQNGQP